MQFTYFKANFQTPIDECKRQYHKLVLMHHPDRGGSEEAMKRVNAEWDYLKRHNFNVKTSKQGSVYTDERQDVPDEVTERFADIIGVVIGFEGVGIEICGSFIWLSGNTYEYRDQIKALGFKWARRKRMWFLAPKEWKNRGTEWSMGRIRLVHGSQIVTEGQTSSRGLLQEAI